MRLDHLLSKELIGNLHVVETLFSFEGFTSQLNSSLIWAYSSVGLERTPDKREVGGSSPLRPIMGN